MKKENQYNAAGQKHGLFKEWHSNGKLFYEATYVNGKRHGIWHEFRNSGSLQWETTWIHGILHGRYCYFDHETPSYIFNNINGEWEGEAIEIQS